MLNMQNVKDIEITEGKVRTIHDKDSRLIWGRLAYDTKYAGDTYQQTYSGENLYNYTDTQSVSASGVTVDDDGWITMTKNNTLGGSTTYINYFSEPMQLAPDTDYAIIIEVKSVEYSTVDNSGYLSLTTGNALDQWNYTFNYILNTLQANSVYVAVQRTKSDLSSAIMGLRMFLATPAGASNSITFRASVLADTSITPETFVYQPYTGGIPAPNPDYPQAVQTVTGEQTVTISDGGGQSATYKVGLTGKNLFNCPSTAKTTANTVFTKIDSNSFRTDFTKTTTTMQSSFTQIRLLGLLPNTTYTISYSSEVTGDTYNRAGQFRMHIGNTWSNYYSGSATFTTPSDVSSVYFVPANAQDVTTPGSNSVVFRNVQVDLGSSATTYEPYYNYELCKIGTYQDYIYKSGDDWYVHKEIGKVVLDGTETWTEVGSPVRYCLTTLADAFVVTDTNVLSPILSNYYISATPSDIYNKVVDYGVSLNSSTGGIRMRNNDFTSRSQYVSWLSSNNTTIYYALATPTDTKITDATLVGQLNAVHEWLTRYGYSATVTGNLPIIINQTNL